MSMMTINYKYSKKLILGSLMLMLGAGQVFADVYHGPAPKVTYPRTAMRAIADCDAPTSQIDLDVNNVRARILNGGDMWWDIFATRNARYEVPKVPVGTRSVHSSFASGLWFGGIDGGGLLRTAGQTYRQTGLDFWPGPLDTVTATVSKEVCAAYDKHFNVLQTQISEAASGGEIHSNVLNWPAMGNESLGQARYLAPFVDVDGDGVYNPAVGDYPTLDPNEPGARPDQMIWWVYNDKGGVHTAYPGGDPIGLEIHALAFAFSTSNEINSMTFYKYRVFNRSSSPLFQTYFGVFTDADLGGPDDDYVGCNMALVDSDGPGPLPAKPRSFGYTYNADNNDLDGSRGGLGYGSTPPAFGIDYFRGPMDENGDEIPMTTFMFFTNQGVTGQDSDPRNATELYRYLRGFWADNQPLVYQSPNGRPSPSFQDTCNYAFPGTTDVIRNSDGTFSPSGRPNWNETNTPGDRRMVQSSGPFTLNPGAVNEVIIGAVWARAQTGDNLTSIISAITADDKAQVLFDNRFKLANGPDPVVLNAVPLDRKINLALEDTYNAERYNTKELDNEDLAQHTYKFQGYRIYQLKNEQVSVNELDDPSKAIEVFQVDIKDTVGKIINKAFDVKTNNVNAYVAIEGSNTGIRHMFEFTADQFSLSSDKSLINGKNYYFVVIPYAFSGDAVYTRYLPSRRSFKIVTVSPNKPTLDGLPVNKFAPGLPVTRLDGSGNGGAVLDLTPQSTEEILKNIKGVQAQYEVSKGPVTIKVYDPVKVTKKDYVLKFNSTYTQYELFYASDLVNPIMVSDTTILNEANPSATSTLIGNEQVAEERVINPSNGRVIRRTPLGFMIKVDNTVGFPGTAAARAYGNNGFLEATMEFADASKPWLSGINGLLRGSNPSLDGWIQGDTNVDPDSVYKSVLGSTWAPYKIIRYSPRNSPLLDPLAKSNQYSRLDSISSYDIVFTPDESKWSHCVVVEGGDGGAETTEGAQKKGNVRLGDIGLGVGRGRFPGYAINVENGERVNIFFAEASNLETENGRDMLWNPTSNTSLVASGGRHYIFVSRTPYDSCNRIYNLLTVNGTNLTGATDANRRLAYSSVDWVSVPVLSPRRELLSTEAKVRLRVARPYRKQVITNLNNGDPLYAFDTRTTIQPFNGDEGANKKAALDLIKIVPNPYYAYSLYEPDRNDFRVRITNLPAQATVQIFTSNGMLVRKFTKTDPMTSFIEWDLRNSTRVPIASGMYIIHINCPGVGEKTLKWLGVMRPIDFTNF